MQYKKWGGVSAPGGGIVYVHCCMVCWCRVSVFHPPGNVGSEFPCSANHAIISQFLYGGDHVVELGSPL